MTTNIITLNDILFSDPKKWDDHARQYDDAVGRSSRLGGTHLISLASTFSPPYLSSPSARAIDLGAGTGSLTFELANRYPSLPILATDISPGMLDQLLANPSSLSTPNISVQVADMRCPISVGAAGEASFSHVFSTMTIQAVRDPFGSGTLTQWARLLRPDGVIAIAVWDFDQKCGPHAIWEEAAIAVNPEYVNPPLLPEGHWNGLRELEEGLRGAGFRDVVASERLGFDVGKEGFMDFFWESGNPMPLERQASFGEKEELGKVRVEMNRLLDEKYEGGRNIPLFAGLAVGRRPV